jgi:hypothetical protein
MASTIKLKNGSGAPLAGDLVQGEPALDLTNKRLYTEDSGGTVIEVGTNPSTIDINAGTIDGTVIGGSSAAAGSFTTLTASDDVNFDSGTLFVDASANSVGIGTTSPSAKLEVNGGEVHWGATSGLGFLSYTGGYPIVGSLGALPLAFYTNAAERMRIDSSGNVGIGTSSPSAKLHIDAGASTEALRVEGSGAYISYLDTSNTQSLGFIQGSDTALNIAAQGSGNTSSVNFIAGGSERMRITSSGDLLVGTTSSPATLISATSGSGQALTSSFSAFTRESASADFPVVVINETGVDGVLLQFRKDGAVVGDIGVKTGTNPYLTIGNNDTGILFNSDGDHFVPWNTSTNSNRDNAIDIGASTDRFKDLYLSGGVYLGGTGAANKLDDYEEGTWTPTFGDGSTSVNGTGAYVKVGKLVTVHFQVANINTSGMTSGNEIVIGGFPFSASSVGQTYQGPVLLDRFTFTGYVVIEMPSGSSTAGLRDMISNTFEKYMIVSDVAVSGGSDIRVTLSYQTDS